MINSENFIHAHCLFWSYSPHPSSRLLPDSTKGRPHPKLMHSFLFNNPLSPVSSAYVLMGVGPCTGIWLNYQGQHPYRELTLPHPVCSSSVPGEASWSPFCFVRECWLLSLVQVLCKQPQLLLSSWGQWSCNHKMSLFFSCPPWPLALTVCSSEMVLEHRVEGI